MLQKQLYSSISLLSVSIIAFQLALMQILSLIQWSHFAYLVISIALMGFGASGTILTIFRKWFIRHAELIIPLFMLLCGLFMGITVFNTKFFLSNFDGFLLFNQPEQIGMLFLACFIYMIPFFFGGAALGLIYTIYSSHIGKLYFADLAGSGLGGAIFTGLLWIFFPEHIIVFISFLPLVSAFLASNNIFRKKILISIAFASITILFTATNKTDLPLSQFKDLKKALSMMGTKILYEESSPYGHLHAVYAPYLRFAPGLSLAWEKSLPPSITLFNNANWFGSIPAGSENDKLSFLDYTLYALPFVASKPQSTLILDAGTGLLAEYSLMKGSREITFVEPNAAAISLLKNELSEEHDSLFFHPSVRIKQLNPRSYLLSDKSYYDLIYFPTVGAFGGLSGILATSENFLLTVEAFQDAWNRLSDDGYIMITAWMDYPSRVPLKLLAIISETMESFGIQDPAKHLAIIRSWGNIGFLVKKTELNYYEINKINEFCDSVFFDPMVLGNIYSASHTTFNMLQDADLYQHFDTILRGNTDAFFAGYMFDVSPTTDNRPFFYRFIKPGNIENLRKTYSFQELAYMEPGYFITFIVFLVIFSMALLLIFVPMFFFRIKGDGIPYTLFYFGGLGIGFMFVEIVLIQQFILFLGEPIYSAATVLSGILLFSGAGSYFSGKLNPVKNTLVSIMLVIIPLIVLYAFGLRYVLVSTVHLNMLHKIGISILLIAPPSFFMGMAFPLGIRLLSRVNDTLIPWAWGVNGYLSVLSAVLAIIISIHTGFTVVLLLAALAYFMALAASLLFVVKSS